MKDISLLSDDALDELLLAQVKKHWLKVAMVVGMAMKPYEAWDEERVGKRIATLVEAGKVESQGDVRNWRHSEIRLPNAR